MPRRSTRPERRPAEWSVEALKRALTSGTRAQDVAILKRIGLLTAEGKANPDAEDWGSRRGSRSNGAKSVDLQRRRVAGLDLTFAFGADEGFEREATFTGGGTIDGPA